ncbi:MAG: CotH kinase family protein [Flavobacteriales bacterium]|nr:CotH kinase family protein [Flavobacteriales bacterium]MCC6939352.1 CotH kinase family protein [Flavobacteriales bacterium]
MKRWSFLAAVVFPVLIHAQPPSDELFGTDQVIDIQLTFAQPNYWDSLLAYYNEGLERQLLASVILTDVVGTYTYDSVGVRFKGNSSYGLPNKKSMKIDFNEYVPGQKYHGMKKINLNNGFNDPTLLREKIFFDFCQDLGVLAPRAVFGNVRMNGSLIGFYGVVEQVDKEFLDRWVDDTNGNMFKAGDNFGTGGGAAADLAWYGTAQSTYEPRYELKTNTTVNDWSDLIDLIDVINNTTPSQLEVQLPALTDWHPLLRSLAIDNLFSNLDSYINSARNYYIYHNDSTGIWQWIKWDANEAFGRYSGGVPNLTNLAPNYVANSRPLMTKIMNTPTFYAAYRTEYCAVFDAFMNSALDPHIDALAALIQPHVFADPNKQYTNAQFTTNLTSNITVTGGPGGGQTVFGLKSFINSRRVYLTGVLGCATIGIDESIDQVFEVFPNPCHEEMRFVLPQGSVVKGIRLVDLTGRQVSAERIGNTLVLGELPTGLYSLIVDLGDRRLTARVMKE